AVRRAVQVALGLTVAVGALGASPASASPGAPPPAVSMDGAGTTAPGLDWGSPPAPALDWSGPAVASPVAPSVAQPVAAAKQPVAAAEQPVAAREPVVVQPGDTLWGIAAEHLPAAATDAQIAQAWPSWWAANRDAVGADPDLITPGTQLDPPTTTDPGA
ncbi:MAG: LysM peptidoglycan-binding domain-containing protein, partial [Actinobacteria bacterium]|nr:LysM peptidoglycan-binding domain-containing protein [Actinomycetota bacterium]